LRGILVTCWPFGSKISFHGGELRRALGACGRLAARSGWSTRGPLVQRAGEDDMDARDLFLDQHAAVHSAAVGGDRMSAVERTFGRLTDEQMRVRPREDLNSLAWLLWHVARAEDVFVNLVLAGRPQVFDEAWTSPASTSVPA
jgi:hypothetical protein